MLTSIVEQKNLTLENPFPSANSLREEIFKATPYASKEQILDEIEKAKKDLRFSVKFSGYLLDNETRRQLLEKGYKYYIQYNKNGSFSIGFKLEWFSAIQIIKQQKNVSLENPFPDAKSLSEETFRAVPYASKKQILNGIKKAKKDLKFQAEFPRYLISYEIEALLNLIGYSTYTSYGTDGESPIGFKVNWEVKQE